MKHGMLWLLVMISGIAGALAARTYFQKTETGSLFQFGRDLPEILYLVEQAYVDDVDMANLMPGAYQGALESVDENASYIQPGLEPEFNARKVYQRTGLVLTKYSGYPYILEVAPGSPAWEAGVRPGNYVRRVNGTSVRGVSIFHVRRAFSREEHLELSLLESGKVDDKVFKFEAASFEPEKVSLNPLENNLYQLQVPLSYPGQEQDLKTELAKVPAGARLLVDLRGNALSEVEDLGLLARFFLPKGKLCEWVAAKDARVPVLNMNVVTGPKREIMFLVDHTTSGAAEIVAASAHDQGVAQVIGEQTLGLPGWYEDIKLEKGGFVRMSTRKLSLPSGKMLTGEGLEPDIEIEVSSYKPEVFLEKVLERLSEPQKAAQ